jgi:uncharacterized tellurite resistance protein B-like protein
MIDSRFEYVSSLQYRVKSLEHQLEAFKSGEKYARMEAERKEQLADRDREIKRLKAELSDAHSETVTVRKYWSEIFDDLEKERRKELAKKDIAIRAMEERAIRAERQRDEALGKLAETRRGLYQALTDLEDERGKNTKLKAQINRDYENSSIPSSLNPNKKKISNNRVKSGRKAGGQPGHEGHGRKRLEPTNIIDIAPPDEYTDSPNYRPTGKTVAKQVINIHVGLSVDEYRTPEFRDVRTGRRVHADFPDGVQNDVNYGGSAKALAFLLNNYCCVSIDKVREFMSELTEGNLRMSKGMINGLGKQFSGKTEAERKAIFCDLLLSPVMNADFTAARLNGKNVQVIVCASPDRVLYSARERKGHDGVRGTPVEDYQNILVHDHDKTFYSYGGNHQECLSHVLRYLKDSMENEPCLKWNGQMCGLIQEMIHYRNCLGRDADADPDEIKQFEGRFLEILSVAADEYEYEPPSDYYKDGFNLYKRLLEYKDSHLLFLRDKRVPATNNLSERLLRTFKRKQKQVMAFRSFGNIIYLCDSMGVIESLRSQGCNLHKSVASLFGL